MEFLLQRELLGLNDFDLLIKGSGDIIKKRSRFNDISTKNRLIVPSSTYWELSKLFSCPYRTFPPEQFKTACQAVLNPDGEPNREFPKNFPWQMVIPKQLFKKEIRNLANNLMRDYEGLDLDYYFSVFKRHDIVFNSLQKAAIDTEQYNQFLMDGNDNTSKAVLKTFAPIFQHENIYYASNVEYDRFSSITGRLTAKSGPGILNLRKDYRQVLRSKWGKDGGIYYLDFKSLEPRLLLALKNSKLKMPEDLYLHVAEEMGLEKNVNRNLIKTVIISMIYGAGDDELIGKLKGQIDYPEDFISSIKEHFGVEDLRLRLKNEYDTNKGKFITNFYKRPIFADSTAPYVLVNYFIQSSAVDVALNGFSNIVERLDNSNGTSYVRPLFVLHDALIVDVHNNVSHLLPKIAKAGSVNIPGFEETKFWLNVERLN